jgi:uncharacterized protein
MTLSRQLRVFLLYARGDRETVHRLSRRLVRDGANVWLDMENILPGQDWQHEIHKAIQTSDMVIVCLSKGFNKQGGYRHEEVKIAVKKANSLPDGVTFIIPARSEMCKLPEQLRRWQCVDLFEVGGYKTLMGALSEHTVSK